MSFSIGRLFASDRDGVPRTNLYLMRLVWLLILVFVGRDSWTHIAAHQGQWEPLEGVAWTVWAAFACFGVLGILHPVRMIPLMLFEVLYKLLWLAVVAYPLWAEGALAGSPVEGIAHAFAWVVLPIISIPWPYVLRTFLWGSQRREEAADAN